MTLTKEMSKAVSAHFIESPLKDPIPFEGSCQLQGFFVVVVVVVVVVLKMLEVVLGRIGSIR